MSNLSLPMSENSLEAMEKKERKTSIVILTCNKLEYTQLCIDSIRKFTDRGTFEIIVVDNNSTDGTVEWLKQQKDIKAIFNSENLGFPIGCNQGIEISTGDCVLLLNNDVIVTPNWLSNLAACLWSSEDIGAVGAVTNNCSNNQVINCSYKDMDEMIEFSRRYNISDPDKWEPRIKLIGFCMLIKRSVIERVGLLDERFTPGNYEDDDYSLRIVKEGYRLMLCKDTFIHHFGSVSFREIGNKVYTILKRNEKIFEEKWGFNSGYSVSVRNEIIILLDNKKSDEINVLEAGCACGGTLLKIKSIYKNARLYGIELNEKAAEIAKTFAEVKVGDIEKMELDFNEEFFDYIIFLDVLEHLYNPCRVLENMKRYLKPEGKVLASIPNVSHYSVIRNLINGNWTYENSGILDKTHIRFFTLSEINEMFYEAGYEVTFNLHTETEINLKDAKFIDSLVNLSDKKQREQYEAYQYLIKAKKQDVKDLAETSFKDKSITMMKKSGIMHV